jgi:hypothetical protein
MSARTSGRRRAALVGALVWTTTLAAGSGAAQAEWGPAQVVSASPTQQAEHGSDPAISQDGRHVAFTGSYAGTVGVWRKRLADGTLELVAEGARAASLSADGRWVAFTTATALDPVLDVNQLGDVYVRDMELPAGAAGAYTLVSARDGADAGLAYEGGGAGSATAGRVALSADGRSVAFTVLSRSDLAGPGTPAGQIAVRRIDERRTILVSTALDHATGDQTGLPAPSGAMRTIRPANAALSADGTTVAWLAANVADLTRTVAGEPARRSLDGSDYVEPLWRRIADGPGAPIRRVTGGGDPFDPACPADGAASPDLEVAAPGANPCDGPFALGRVADAPPGTLGSGGAAPAQAETAPQLSADGWTVALLVAAPLRSSAVVPALPPTPNVYVADMRPGLTRQQALQPLTAWASSDFANTALTGEVRSVAISADGRRVAFATPRTSFPLSPPLLLTPPLARVGDAELYDVDRATGELRRVTRQYDGGPIERPSSAFFFGGAYAPAYAAGGRRIVFASLAPKLFYGDGNGESDVFAVDWSEPDAGAGPPQQHLGEAPGPVALRPRWRLSVTARTRRDGRVAIEAVVPAAGAVAVTAKAARPQRPRRASARRAARRRKPRTVVRVVASARARARRSGLVVIPLTLRRGERATSRRGIPATAHVSFAAGGRRLRASVAIRFARPSRRGAAPRPRSGRSGR